MNEKPLRPSEYPTAADIAYAEAGHRMLFPTLATLPRVVLRWLAGSKDV